MKITSIEQTTNKLKSTFGQKGFYCVKDISTSTKKVREVRIDGNKNKKY